MSSTGTLTSSEREQGPKLSALAKSVSKLNEATENAIKYHGKYTAAISALGGALERLSHDLEETRSLMKVEEGAELCTGDLCSNFATRTGGWARAPEVVAVRVKLERLSENCAAAKKALKQNIRLTEERESVMKKCKKMNSDDVDRKIQKGPPHKAALILQERKVANENLAELKSLVMENARATTQWMAQKQISTVKELLEALGRYGELTHSMFNRLPSPNTAAVSRQGTPAAPTNPSPSPSLQQQQPLQQRGGPSFHAGTPTNGVGGAQPAHVTPPPLPPPLYGNAVNPPEPYGLNLSSYVASHRDISSAIAGNAASTAQGIPLEFGQL